MPPKSSITSAKAASIPTRPSNIHKNSNGGSFSNANGTSGKAMKTAYEQEQQQYKKEIDQIQARISEVRLKIGDPKNGGANAPLIARRQELRAEMETIRESQFKEKSSRGKVLDQIRVTNEILQRKIKELNANRAKLTYKSVSEVDAKIKQLDSQIESGTMRIVEEKKALTEIQNLKKSKKLIESFIPQQESIENEKIKLEELKKRIDDPSSKAINDRWNEIKLELDQINNKLDESSKSRDVLFQERNKLQDDLNSLYDKRRESGLRHKEANEKYFAKKQEDEQRRINRQKAEREAQAKAEIEQAQLEMREQAALPAYGREIEDCRTLILYFDKLIGNVGSNITVEESNELKSSSTSLPKIKEVRQVDQNDGFEGMVAIKKKGTEQEEFFMGGGKKNNNSNNNKKNKKSTTTNDLTNLNNQPLNLPLSTINALFALAVPVPMTREQVICTISTLSEKKKWFTENQERVTKQRIEETEAKIAAAKAPAPVPVTSANEDETCPAVDESLNNSNDQVE